MLTSAGLISLIVFLCAFGAALLGMRVGALLPEQHLDANAKDVVRGSAAIVVTMVALVLGLLIASAKAYFDTQNTELTQMSADVVVLDRMLAHYGPGAAHLRAVLRSDVAALADNMISGKWNPSNALAGNTEGFFDQLQELPAKDDEQRAVKSQALALTLNIGRTRWLMYEQRAASVPMPLIVAIAIWLVLIFLSSGVFARPSPTVVVSFFASAVSVAGAIWLIAEMYSPYTGFIRLSGDAMRAALSQLGG